MTLKQNDLNRIRYTRSTNIGDGNEGDVSHRTIIPSYVPTSNVKAIDVTTLQEDKQTELAELMNEYSKYHQQMMKNISPFETWLELTHPDKTEHIDNMKWRTFKLSNLSKL